jgi:hypothetical protein
VRKADLLSISLGLKTVVLAEASDHNAGRPTRILRIFFPTKPTHVLQKNFHSNFAFFAQL